MLAIEQASDFLADLIADGVIQAKPSESYGATYELVRQEVGMTVTDAFTMCLGVPDAEAEYQQEVPSPEVDALAEIRARWERWINRSQPDWGMGV